MDFQEDANETSDKNGTDDSEQLYALWISRDPEEPGEGGKKFGSLTLSSTMFYEKSALGTSQIALLDSEKSFGQEIIMKSMKLAQPIDHKDDLDGNVSLVKEKSSQQEQCILSEPICKEDGKKGASTKAPGCHHIAKFWQNQIENAKALDTSNVQCQIEGTYEQTYQTLDVSDNISLIQ